MCGIAGYYGESPIGTLTKMGESLKHRGPDAYGEIVFNKVGLAHRRLSILDLSETGVQPMVSADGRYIIIFNGEIYNYQELRKKYLKQESFRGTSDTEVILLLFKKKREQAFSLLRGMFALAIYDKQEDRLFLARDAMGKKPLYWTKVSKTFLFASELKALRKHPDCPAEIDRRAIAEYLVYEYIPGNKTIYENVNKVLPGTYLIYDGAKDNITQTQFYTFKPTQGSYIDNFETAKTDLFRLLQQAVETRMVADVPVGVFLSGGLDSSTIAYFAQKASDQPVRTFSIGFEDESFNESSYAEAVASALGTEHHEHIVTVQDLLRVITEIPQVLDEPMADSSIVPTLLLSKFASSKVKVTLGGDGADELFWGYETFFAHKIGSYYEQLPSFVRKGIRAGAELLPVSHSYMSFDFKAKKFLSGFDVSKERRNTYWLSAFTPEEVQSLMDFDLTPAQMLTSSDAFYKENLNFWDSLQLEYLRGYLEGDILTKVDRASMAHGLEVRAPFLDLNIVDFALTLPMHYKYKRRQGKYVLKETMRSHLPEQIIDRPKKGFNIPIGKWIQVELKELFVTTLLEGKLVTSGLCRKDRVEAILDAHVSGRVDNRKKLWTLLILALWLESWYE